MALAPAVQGAVGTSQLITWKNEDGVAQNLTGATLTGKMESLSFPETASITGTLAITNAVAGEFRWTYSEADLSTTGVFDVQFTATYSAGAIEDSTMYESFYVHRRLGEPYITILTPAGYESVRALIDTSLTEDVLPDRIIANSVFHGAAELAVIERDPLASTRVGEERAHVFNAVIYLTAANILPSVPFLIREDFGDYNYSRFLDKGYVERRVGELRQKANAELNLVLGLDIFGSMPAFFDVAQGRRGA